jgi:hypothetical protein
MSDIEHELFVENRSLRSESTALDSEFVAGDGDAAVLRVET